MPRWRRRSVSYGLYTSLTGQGPSTKEGIMRSRLIVRALGTGALLLLGAPPLPAQTSNATLQGRIVDAGGGVMPGVMVKARSVETGLERPRLHHDARHDA